MRACADAEELGFRERILRFFPTVFQPRHGKEAGGAILEPVENVLKSTLKEAKIELIPAKEAQIKAEPVPLQIEEIPPKEAKIEEISLPCSPG